MIVIALSLFKREEKSRLYHTRLVQDRVAESILATLGSSATLLEFLSQAV